MALLELKGITAGYGQNVILRDFNLNVERGEFVSLLGSSGARLHGKAAIFDRRTLFVGSLNLDPRSVQLNSEQGLLVTDEVLAAQLSAMFVPLASTTQAEPRTLLPATISRKRA